MSLFIFCISLLMTSQWFHTFFSSPASNFMTITLNSLSDIFLIYILVSSLAMILFHFIFWAYFSVFWFGLMLSHCFHALEKPPRCPALETKNFMKKRSYNVLHFNFPCLPEYRISEASHMCIACVSYCCGWIVCAFTLII